MAKNKQKKQNKERKLRVLFSSNAPWSSSGYAQQMADILPRMVKEGYQVAISAFYGLQGGVIDLDGIRCFPVIGDKWGSDAMVEHAKAFKADVVITLQDLWVVNPQMLQQIPKWIPVVPVDHEPIPESIYDRLKMAYRVISYAPYGYRELKRKGMHSTYIQHTVDTKIFKKMDRAKIRKKIGIPEDLFLFGMVAANKDNPPRKGFQHVLDSFVKFKKKHPKSGIYFHTLLEQGGGFNIKTYAKFLGIQDSIYHVQPYEQLFGVSKNDMPMIYNAFDCLLAPSTNEGFGVPIIEAQACEVPVITNNFTAMPDLIKPGKTGFLTEIMYKRFTPLNAYIGIPNPDSIYKNMEKVYSANREKMGKEARKWVKSEFDSDKVYNEKWSPFFKMLEKEIYQED